MNVHNYNFADILQNTVPNNIINEVKHQSHKYNSPLSNLILKSTIFPPILPPLYILITVRRPPLAVELFWEISLHLF